MEADFPELIVCSHCQLPFNLLDERDQTYKRGSVRQIRNFELVQELGRGAFGSVWKARDTTLNRIVAVKIPSKDRLTREETEQFFREARAAAQLRQSNIVAIHEVGREGETAFIVSDLDRGVRILHLADGDYCCTIDIDRQYQLIDVRHGRRMSHAKSQQSEVLSVKWHPSLPQLVLLSRRTLPSRSSRRRYN